MWPDTNNEYSKALLKWLYNRLYNRLYSRLYNRLHRVYAALAAIPRNVSSLSGNET